MNADDLFREDAPAADHVAARHGLDELVPVDSTPVEPPAPDAPVRFGGNQRTGAPPLDAVRHHLARYVSAMRDSDLDLLTL